MGSSYSRTRTRIFRVSSRSTSIPCVSGRRSCGARVLRPAILFTSICGIATLSTPDLNSLPSLPRDKDGPTFAEPWQGQAFGLAVRLSEEGHFTWKEWATALAEELK